MTSSLCQDSTFCDSASCFYWRLGDMKLTLRDVYIHTYRYGARFQPKYICHVYIQSVRFFSKRWKGMENGMKLTDIQNNLIYFILGIYSALG